MRTEARLIRQETKIHRATRACAAVAALAAGLLAWPAFGADWPYLLATGGDQTFVTNVGTKAYGVHIFTNTASAGTFTNNPGVTNQVQYLIVGGGGGGGCGANVYGGGGGGGGVVSNTPSSLLPVRPRSKSLSNGRFRVSGFRVQVGKDASPTSGPSHGGVGRLNRLRSPRFES